MFIQLAPGSVKSEQIIFLLALSSSMTDKGVGFRTEHSPCWANTPLQGQMNRLDRERLAGNSSCRGEGDPIRSCSDFSSSRLRLWLRLSTALPGAQSQCPSPDQRTEPTTIRRWRCCCFSVLTYREWPPMVWMNDPRCCQHRTQGMSRPPLRHTCRTRAREVNVHCDWRGSAESFAAYSERASVAAYTPFNVIHCLQTTRNNLIGICLIVPSQPRVMGAK